MSARLDEALKRLDAAVAALETMPRSDSAASPTPATPSATADHLAEIAAIRQLVDQAMAVISAQQDGGGNGTK